MRLSEFIEEFWRSKPFGLRFWVAIFLFSVLALIIALAFFVSPDNLLEITVGITIAVVFGLFSVLGFHIAWRVEQCIRRPLNTYKDFIDASGEILERRSGDYKILLSSPLYKITSDLGPAGRKMEDLLLELAEGSVAKPSNFICLSKESIPKFLFETILKRYARNTINEGELGVDAGRDDGLGITSRDYEVLLSAQDWEHVPEEIKVKFTAFVAQATSVAKCCPESPATAPWTFRSWQQGMGSRLPFQLVWAPYGATVVYVDDPDRKTKEYPTVGFASEDPHVLKVLSEMFDFVDTILKG